MPTANLGRVQQLVGFSQRETGNQQRKSSVSKSSTANVLFAANLCSSEAVGLDEFIALAA